MSRGGGSTESLPTCSCNAFALSLVDGNGCPEMKSFLTIVVVGVIGVGGYLVWQSPSTHVEIQNPKKKATSEVTLRDIEFEVTVAGNIEPSEQVSVRPEINGRIASLPVDIGDDVEKGTVLFTLDDKELQNQRSSSETEIDRAKLNLEKADLKYKRNQRLFKDDLMSEEIFDDSRIDYRLAENSLERAQKEYLLIEEKLSKTQILAPFDCTVLLRPVSIGQAVSGSGGVSGGTEVLAIADLKQLVINAHVNQVDVVRLKVDQMVDVQLEAIAGLSVQGRIERIAPQAVVRNGIKGFAARIVLSEIDDRIQPGMTANLTIPINSANDVVAVPLAAVFSEKNKHHVFLETDTGSERRSVEIGVADYKFVEIVSGVSAGDVVWLELPPEQEMDPDSNIIDAAKKR
jgi:HlyD family secretion protein